MSQDPVTPSRGAPSAPSPESTLEAIARIAARRGAAGARAATPPSGPVLTTPTRRLLGEILVDEGLVTRRQLDAALRLQAEQRPGVPVGQLLVEQGAVRQEQLDAVLDKYRLGTFLVEAGVITREQLETALREQHGARRRLGEVLIQLRYVTEAQLRQALAKHFGVRFVEPNDVDLDRGLAKLVDRDYARRHRVVPVGRTATHLTVAMDDPGDQTVIRDLGRATGLRIEAVTTTSLALRRAFGRVYGEAFDRTAAAPTGGATAQDPDARHTETVRILSAVRAASERVRQNLDAGARRLQAIQHAPIPPAAPGASGRLAGSGLDF